VITEVGCGVGDRVDGEVTWDTGCIVENLTVIGWKVGLLVCGLGTGVGIMLGCFDGWGLEGGLESLVGSRLGMAFA
jgi:hypothetical protein